MSRLSGFLLHQRFAWRRLFARSRTVEFTDDALPVAEMHPAERCRCLGHAVQSSIAYMDHKPDFPWLLAMCQTCHGTGCCARCHGDGCDPEAA